MLDDADLTSALLQWDLAGARRGRCRRPHPEHSWRAPDLPAVALIAVASSVPTPLCKVRYLTYQAVFRIAVLLG